MGIFKKTYTAKIDINADSRKVFQILRQHDQYHQWNSFTPKVELEWEIGSPVQMEVHLSPGRKPTRQTEYLRQFDADRFVIVWGMKWGFLLTALRTQRVEDQGSGSIYVTEDVIQGPLTPLVHWLYGENIQHGFDRVCSGLKRFAESQH